MSVIWSLLGFSALVLYLLVLTNLTIWALYWSWKFISGIVEVEVKYAGGFMLKKGFDQCQVVNQQAEDQKCCYFHKETYQFENSFSY